MNELEILCSYVPRFVLERLIRNSSTELLPRRDNISSSILLLELTGLNDVAQRFRGNSQAGDEKFAFQLNSYFSQVIDLIISHGGDVAEFGGDILIALWPAEDNLEMAILQAAQCGLTICNTIPGSAASEDLNIGLRAAIGAGNIHIMYSKSVDDHEVVTLVGQCLTETSIGLQHGHIGEAVITYSAWNLIQEHCNALLLPSGYLKLNAVHDMAPLGSVYPSLINAQLVSALRVLIPATVLTSVDAGQVSWLAESRHITVLLIDLRTVNRKIPSPEADMSAFDTIHSIVYSYGGSVSRVTSNNGGYKVLVVFSLQPVVNMDAAVGAVQAAMEIQGELTSLDVDSVAVITTGQAFCGLIGNEQRRKYAVMGKAVHTAELLLQAAPDSLICDRATYQAARTKLRFENVMPGGEDENTEEMLLYRPIGVLAREVIPSRQTTIIGRSEELLILAARLHALIQGSAKGIVIIQGDAGIGKSRLLEAIQREATQLGITVYSGIADEAQQSALYNVWRPIYVQALRLDIISSLAARRSQVLAQLESDAKLLNLAPLLNPILGLNIPENDLTSQMKGQVRADNTHAILAALLRIALAGEPTLLILEDAHWMDSASWALSLMLSREISKLLIVIAMRPRSDDLSTEHKQLLNGSTTQRIQLNPLSYEENLSLTRERLNASSVPEALGAMIYARTGGNPFFSEELIYALRDLGLISNTDGKVDIVADMDTLKSLAFPATVQRTIMSRVDRLVWSQQLVLKVASVIGQRFAYQTLHDIYSANTEHLLSDLLQLEALDFVVRDVEAFDTAYTFKHETIREVMYGILLSVQREALHRSVAGWYENEYSGDLTQFYPLLAYHWGRGGDLAKTLEYLEKSGDQALQSHANREALDYFSEALALSQGATVEQDGVAQPDAPRMVAFARKLGEAYYGLGNTPESTRYVRTALAFLGFPWPPTTRRLIADLLRQCLIQLLHRVWPFRLLQSSSEAQGRIPEAVRCFERLSRISYFAHDGPSTMYSTICGLNLAEMTELGHERVRLYTAMCYVTGLIPIHRLARTYNKKARIAATRLGDDLFTEADILTVTGYYAFGVGEWEEALNAFKRAIEIAELLGDRRMWSEAWAILPEMAYHRGDLVQVRELAVPLCKVASEHGQAGYHILGLWLQSRSLLSSGRYDEATALAQTAVRLLPSDSKPPRKFQAFAALALAYAYQGKFALAQETIEIAESHMSKSRPIDPVFFFGYSAVAEACLIILEAKHDQQTSDLAAIRHCAHRASVSLKRFAGIFPIIGPRANLYAGRQKWLSGHHIQAHRAWNKSLETARRLGMIYEEGLAHYEIGRHAGEPLRSRNLARASEIFGRLNAVYNLERVHAAEHE